MGMQRTDREAAVFVSLLQKLAASYLSVTSLGENLFALNFI